MRDPLPELAPSAHSETLWLRVRRSLIGQRAGPADARSICLARRCLPIGALGVLDYLHAGNIHFIQVSALAAALVIVLGAWQTRRIVGSAAPPAGRHPGHHGTRFFAPDCGQRAATKIAQLARAFNEMARSLGMNFATLHVLSQIDKTILTKLGHWRSGQERA